MDKTKEDTVSLDEFRQFFNKLSTCDFDSLTEFLFQIFDTNGMQNLLKLKSVVFIRQKSSHGDMLFWVTFEKKSKKTPPPQVSTIQQCEQSSWQKSS